MMELRSTNRAAFVSLICHALIGTCGRIAVSFQDVAGFDGFREFHDPLVSQFHENLLDLNVKRDSITLAISMSHQLYLSAQGVTCWSRDQFWATQTPFRTACTTIISVLLLLARKSSAKYRTMLAAAT